MKAFGNMKYVLAAAYILGLVVFFLPFGSRHPTKPDSTSMIVDVGRSDKAGRMDNDVEPLSPGTVTIGATRRQLIGVRLATVNEQPMTYALRLYGRVVADETRTFRVNASTDSWIRSLSDTTTGSIVAKDQILAEALAPAYYNAQLTYLIALDNLDRIKQQLGGQLRHQQSDLANNQIRVAVQNLQNLGITDAQTEDLANKRQARPYLEVRAPSRGVVLSRKLTLNQWFKASEEFYTIADLDVVWVYADVYEDEAVHMRPGMAVAVRHPQTGRTFDAKVSEVLPLFDPNARTLKVRIDVPNPDYDLRPDMFVDVVFPISLPPCLHVPAEAIIDIGTRAVVYVDSGNGTFEPRRVSTGWQLGNWVEITKGLSAGETIAVSGNFLIDSESRMEFGGQGVDTGLMVDPVCGRYVYAETSAMFELTSEYRGEMVYFHSKGCKKAFDAAPEKYRPEKDGPGVDIPSPVQEDPPRTWTDLLTTAWRGPANGETSVKPADKPATKYPTTPEVINWKESPKEGEIVPEWSEGWGGFPGAKYLGIRRESQETTRPLPPASSGDNSLQNDTESPLPAGVDDSRETNASQTKAPAAAGPAPAGQP